ncbi:MAG: sensor histidine kinase [Chitinophagaceae bacterium]|nr:sensor histidine kinase [Chitinophagaceae bacterium]
MKCCLYGLLCLPLLLLIPARCAAASPALKALVGNMEAAYRNHSDSLFTYINQARGLAEQEKDYDALMIVYKIEGNFYFLSSDYKKAHESYATGIRLGEQHHLGKGLITLYYEIAGVYSKNGNKALSDQNILKGLKLADKTSDTSCLADGLNRIGIHLERDGKLDSSLHCYQLSYELYKAVDDSVGMSYSLENQATTYGQMKNFREAIARIKLSLSIRELKNDRYGIAIANINISEIYQQDHKIDSAVKYALIAEKAAKEVGFLDLVQYTYEQLYMLYKKKNNTNLALHYFELRTQLKDSIFNAERTKQIAEFSTRFDTERKEQQIKVLSKQKTIQRLALFAAVLLFVVMVIVGYIIFRNRKEKENKLRLEAAFQLQLQEAEARNALQNERLRISRELHDNIGSHLTFINATVDNMGEAEGKMQQVKELTNETIRELRKTVWLINKSSVRIEEFVVKLRDFLKNIPHLHVEAQIADPEAILKAELITELFRAIQESVNNALKYSGAEKIIVQIRADAAQIAIEVTDNGSGFDVARQKGSGFGLENMEQRMQGIGGSYAIESLAGKGTKVSLQAPL